MDADFDDTVRRIETPFNSFGELEFDTRHDHSTNHLIMELVSASTTAGATRKSSGGL